MHAPAASLESVSLPSADLSCLPPHCLRRNARASVGAFSPGPPALAIPHRGDGVGVSQMRSPRAERWARAQTEKQKFEVLRGGPGRATGS